jgi:hypothetical protein
MKSSQEAARIGDLERAALPFGVVRFGSQRDTCALRTHRNLIDVLRRRHEDPHADPLLPVASFLPVVLTALAGTHHHAEQRSIVFPPLVDSEAKGFIELDALL